MENRNLKISFNKSGSGSLTPRLSLPITWIREMGISQEDREVVVSLYEDFILVRKKNSILSSDNATIEDRTENKNISFNKSGSGSVSCRLILPMNFIKHLNIDNENRDVVVEYENNITKIKKA